MEANQIDTGAGQSANQPPVLATPAKAVVDKLLKSTSAIASITEFLSVHKLIALNSVNQQFYNQLSHFPLQYLSYHQLQE